MEVKIDIRFEDEIFWLLQQKMDTLYNVATHIINYHLKKVFSDSELAEDSVSRFFRHAANDGKHSQ